MNDSVLTTLEDPNKLGTVDVVINAPGLFVGPANIILCTLFMLLCISDRKRFHPNFMILRFHLIVAFYLNAFTHITIISTVYIDGFVIPTQHYFLWFYCVVLGGGVATELMRYLWVSIFIERCFATFYSDVYENEHKRFLWLPIVLTIFVYTAATVYSYLMFFVMIPEYISYAWNLGFDLIGVISIFTLYKLNIRRRKLKAHSNVRLSQRYQIVENMRILNIIFPIIITGICFTLFGTILRITTTMIDPLKFLFRYTIVVYYVSLNIFELIALILWIRKDARYRKKLSSFYKQLFHTKTCDQSTSSSNHRFVLRNVEGDMVFMEQNTTAHFSTLDLMWNEGNLKAEQPRKY